MASKLSKKHLFALSGTAAAVMLLAGCGASESSDDNVAAYETNAFGVEFAKPGNQVSQATAASDGMIYIVGSSLTGDNDGSSLYLKDFSFTNASGEGSYVLQQYIVGAGTAAFKIFGDNFVCGMTQPEASQRPNGELETVATDSVQALTCGETEAQSGSDILYNFASNANYTFLLSYQVTDGVVDFNSFTLTITDKAEVDVPPLSLPIYIRGGLNGAGDDWSAREENLLAYQGNNVYALEKEFPAGTAISYKAAGANWEADGSVYNCGGAGSVAVDSTSPGECGATSGNVSVVTSDSGLYKFTVDYTSQAIPVFGFELVEAVELHPFGKAVGTGISGKNYFVSPELTDGVAREKGAFSVGAVKNTYVTSQVRLDEGTYTFFIQDPSGTVQRFGGNATTIVANRNNADQPETGSMDVVSGSNEMITLVVEQAGDYYIGLDMRSATARVGFFADIPQYCKGTCVPEDFGAVVENSDTADQSVVYLRGDITGSDWAAREGAQFKANGSIYTLTIPQLRAATYNFKFASLDWATFNCGLSTVEGSATELNLDGDAIVGYCQQGDADDLAPDNITLTIPVKDDYTFTLDLTDTTMPTFNIETGKGGEVGQDIWLRGSLIDADWSASPEGKLNKLHAAETYYVTLTDVAAGDYSFKFADAEWANINCGGADVSELTLDADPIVGSCDGSINDGNGPANLSVSISEANSYTFVLDYNDPSAPTFQAITGQLPSGLEIYVRGSLIDAGWSALPEGLMQRVGFSGLYDATLSLVAGDYAFKIADSEWADTNCGALDVATLEIDGPSLAGSCDGTINDGNGPANIELSVATDGDYLLTIDLTDPQNASIRARSEQEIFVRGSLIDADWSALPEGQMSRVGVTDKFSVTLPLVAGDYMFKIADAEWAVVNCGALDDTALVIDGDALAGSCDGTINDGNGPNNIGLSVETDGNYMFTIDMADPNAASIVAKSVAE